MNWVGEAVEADGLDLGGRGTAGGEEWLKLASATPTELSHGVWNDRRRRRSRWCAVARERSGEGREKR